MTDVPSLQRLALGKLPHPLEPGDGFTLDNGLRIVLIYAEDNIAIFRAFPSNSPPEMWTNHQKRRGLYIHVGDWPATFNTDDAIEQALEAQLKAEIDFDLNSWSPEAA